MDQYLVEIERLAREQSVITYEGLPSVVLMNSPVLEKELMEVKHSLQGKVPDDYVEFLKYYNGGVLFKYDDLAGFKLFSARELLDVNAFQRNEFGDDWNDDILLFCASIADNEYLGFKRYADRYEILDCVMYEMPERWRVIGSRFDRFIYSLIQKRGRKFWLW